MTLTTLSTVSVNGRKMCLVKSGKVTPACASRHLPPCRGKFTAAGAVSSYSLENSDESLENSFATLGGNEKVQG